MVFNVTFNNISAIWWQSVLLVKAKCTFRFDCFICIVIDLSDLSDHCMTVGCHGVNYREVSVYAF
jgi:hypothetical protein